MASKEKYGKTVASSGMKLKLFSDYQCDVGHEAAGTI